MRLLLTLIFSLILLGMVWVTVVASLERNVFTAGSELMADAWFRATLADAYFGFVTFYVWVAYRERSWTGRILWLIAIMLLGNMAMAVYGLWQLSRANTQWPLYAILLRPEHYERASLAEPAP